MGVYQAFSVCPFIRLYVRPSVVPSVCLMQRKLETWQTCFLLMNAVNKSDRTYRIAAVLYYVMGRCLLVVKKLHTANFTTRTFS